MDSLQEILFSLRQNKLRTGLTAFGVFWGIFMLMVMLGSGKGMQNGITNMFGDETLDTMFVFAKTTRIPYEGMPSGRTIKFTDADVARVRKEVEGVRFVSVENSLSAAKITYKNAYANYALMGIDDDYFRIKEKVPFLTGRKFNQFDEQDVRKTTIIGKPVAERLFGNVNDAIGKDIQVNGIVMKVIAVFHDRSFNETSSQRIYIPLSTFKTAFRPDQIADVIVIRPLPNANGLEVERKAVELLKKRHKVAPDDKFGIFATNLAEGAQMVNGLFLGINTFIWFVGLGTLTAGIVGVSNIMMITVKERTREFGIRKALGATPRNIVGTLIFESVLVTSVAGYLGLVLGVGLIEAVAYALKMLGVNSPFFKSPEINFQVAITAVILLVTVGAIAGLIPALKAARITPIEAMRAD